MQIRIIYILFTAVWMLCCSSHLYAYDQTPKSKSWGYTPTYSAQTPASTYNSSMSSSTGSSAGSSYTGSTPVSGFSYKRTLAPEFNQDVYPSYRFQSTSRFSSTGATPSGMTFQSGVCKTSSLWDDPEEDPVGVIPNPQPVGEPLVLLIMAMLYVGYLRLRRIRTQRTEKVQ